MDSEVVNKRFSERLFEELGSFILLALILLSIVLQLRIFELIYNQILHSTNANVSLPGLYSAAFATDVFFWLRFSALLFFIYLLLFFISKKLSKVVFVAIVFIYLLLHLSLTLYFSQSLVPLGSDIYGYSIADIRQTVGASGHVSISIILFAIIFILAYIAAFYYIPKKVKLGRRFSFSVVVLSILTVTLSSFIVAPNPSAGSEYLNNLTLNKTDFFLSQSFRHFYPEDTETDIYADAYIGDFGDGAPPIANFEYIDEVHYPFLHKDNSPDVLSPFLNPTNQPPNIVILLVEGLGRAFTNDGAYLGNFTPFIDSLSSRSLYWDNFLSEAGRTFAVLPSVLGSLPFLKTGFSEMGEEMPQHLSLVSLLKSNGYETSFYYGGDSEFDNMEMFLKKSNIDKVNDQRAFEGNYVRMPKSENGFSWGYGDKELFRKYFDTKELEPKKPYLDVVLTVSTHTPFLINEQEEYLNRFEARMNQLGFDEGKKDQYRDYKYQFASILFTDDAIKGFINSYSKRADFNNTIFFITGDHRMPEIPMISKIDRYHVPFLIYSPLLTRAAKFSSISTHFDITPSILAYLKRNHRLELPSLVSWIGSGLDTSRSLVNSHAYPLLQTKTELVDFISGDNLLNSGQLFKLKQGLRSSAITDEPRVASLQHSFDEFKKKNQSVVDGAPLLPDSILQRYLPK